MNKLPLDLTYFFSILGLEDSVESLVAVDTEHSIELALVNNRITDVNQTVLEVDSRVGELDVTLVALEDTVAQIDGRVSQLEVSGEYN